MKKLLFLLPLFFLSACEAPQSTSVPTATPVISVAVSPSPTTTVLPTASSSPAPTPLPSSISALPEGDFHKAIDPEFPEQIEFLGTIYARGYIEIKQQEEPFCPENCKVRDHVYFVLKEYTPKESVNGFFSAISSDPVKKVELGCSEDNIISYITDATGKKSFSQKDSARLLGSESKGNITLKIVKNKFLSHMGPPDCYTPFSSFEVL